jgi:tetratricopeptide (TPR) repeat protein
VFRKGIGDDTKAIDDTMMFIAKFGGSRPAMAATAFFSLGAIYDKLGEPDKIVRHLREYIAKYGDKGGADRLVTAWSKIGQTLWQQSCPIKTVQGSCVKVERESALPTRLKIARKDKFCSQDDSKVKVTVLPRDERRVREAIAAFDHAIAELDRRGGKVDGDQRGALYYYAMAKLDKAERDYEAYLAVPIPSGLDFDKAKPQIAKRSMKRFEDWFTHKRDIGAAARKQYEAVIALNDGPTAIASAARLGQISQNFAGQLFRAEIPADVRSGPGAEEASQIYCDTLEAKALPLEDDALMSYQACLNTSLKLAWFSDLSRVCEYELGQLRPKEFPQSRELSHAPDQVARIGDLEAPSVVGEAH